MESNSGIGFDNPAVSYKVIVINVGPGDATIIQATDDKGGKRNYLIDGGPSGRSEANFMKTLQTFCKTSDTTFQLDGIMITHPDADHKNGISRLLKDYPPNKTAAKGESFVFKGPFLISNIAGYTKIKSLLRKNKFELVKDFKPGDPITGFEKEFIFYYPLVAYTGLLYKYTETVPPVLLTSIPETSKRNKSSILLTISDPKSPISMLISLNGDAAGSSVFQLVNNKEPNIFKVLHHGSKYNNICAVQNEPNNSLAIKRCSCALALLEIAVNNEYSIANALIDDEKKGNNYETHIFILAASFNAKLIELKLNTTDILQILKSNHVQILANCNNDSIPYTDKYTNRVTDVVKQLQDKYAQIQKSICKSKIQNTTFIQLTSVAIYMKIIITSLVKQFYIGIKSRTYFNSSGTKYGHPDMEVINGIILAAKVHRSKDPNFNCRILLTNGDNLTEGLPEFQTDSVGIEKWTNYVSIQFCLSTTASVSIDPFEHNPMQQLVGTNKFIPSWARKRLRDDSESSPAAVKLKYKRKDFIVAANPTFFLQMENIEPAGIFMKSKVLEKNFVHHNLESFLKLINCTGHFNCAAILEIILSKACLNDIIINEEVKKVLGTLFATILPLDVNNESTFQISDSEILEANMILKIPDTPIKFENKEIQSICILITNPLTVNLTIDLKFEVDDSGVELHICIPLQSYVTSLNRSLTNYVKCLNIDLPITNMLNNIILLQQSGTQGYLSMRSLNQAIIMPCVHLETNYLMSTVDFNTDVTVNSANLVALVPPGFEIDLGISVGVKLHTFNYIIPNIKVQTTIEEPYIQSEAYFGKQQVRINAYARTSELASLYIQIIDNSDISSIIELLKLDDVINQLKVPLINQLLSNLRAIDIYLQIQEIVSKSTAVIISELGLNCKFEGFSKYLQNYLPMLKSMDKIECSAVVYYPTLKTMSVGFEAIFTFMMQDHANTFSAKYKLKPIYSPQLTNSYNIFSLSFKTDTPGGLKIADILVLFGLENAVNDAKTIPLVNTMISKIKLEALSFQFNCEQKAIESFILVGSIVELDLVPGKITVTEFSANLEYSQGSWSVDFTADISIGPENAFIVSLKLSYSDSSNIQLSFENNNIEFTVEEFLKVFDIGKIDVPVVSDLIHTTINSVKLTVDKSEKEFIITEGELTLYLERLDIGLKLEQVHFNVMMYKTIENTLNISFAFKAFISEELFLEVSYDSETQILSGQVFIASFQHSNLSETITTLSEPLQTNNIFDKISKYLPGIMQVDAKISSKEFSIVSLTVELHEVLTIGKFSLEKLQFEFKNENSSRIYRLLASLQIHEPKQSMIIEFNLNQATTITAEIKENSITFGTFLRLFELKDTDVHIPESSECTNFFDLIITSGTLEIGIKPFEIIGFECQVKTVNKFTILENPLISLEQVILHVKAKLNAKKGTLDVKLEGLFKLTSVTVKLIGKVTADGSIEFSTIVTNESAKLQDIIDQLTPSTQAPSKIPAQVTSDLAVNHLCLYIFFSKDEKFFNFTAVSNVNWCLDLKFEKFSVKDLGGFIHYATLPKKEFQVFLKGKFQFSETIEMKCLLHFGSTVDTVLDVAVADLSNVSIPGITDDLLKFNNIDHEKSSITFASLLPESMTDISLLSAHINLNITQSVFIFMGNLKSLGSGVLVAGQFGEKNFGYIFGISLPNGIKWGDIFTSLSFIDKILTVTNLNCMVSALHNVKVGDVVTKMKAAQKSAIVGTADKSFQFPFSNLQLDDSTKYTEVTMGVSVYAEFKVSEQEEGSLFKSLIEIGDPNSPLPDIILSSTISKKAEESVFYGEINQLILLGAVKCTNIKLTYKPKGVETFKLSGKIEPNFEDTNVLFYGSLTVSKTETTFTGSTNPDHKPKNIINPLGMFGLSLEEIHLSLIYTYVAKPISSEISFGGTVNFYSAVSDSPDRAPTITLSAELLFVDFQPKVVSVSLKGKLSIVDLVATIFNIQFNSDFPTISFDNGLIYYANLDEGKDSITIGNVVYKKGYHISSDVDMFSAQFNIEASLTNNPYDLLIGGSALKPIDLTLVKFTGIDEEDKPNLDKGPGIFYHVAKHSSEVYLTAGIVLFDTPIATIPKLGYNITKKVFFGTVVIKLTYPLMHSTSISFEWSKEHGFTITSWPMAGNIDIGILDKLKNTKSDKGCEALVDLAFDAGVKTKFNFDPKFRKPNQEEVSDFMIMIDISGTYEVILIEQTIITVPLPNISVGLPYTHGTSLIKVSQFFIETFTANLYRIASQILDQPAELAKLMSAVALKSISKRIIGSLVCRGVKESEIPADLTNKSSSKADTAAGESEGLGDAVSEALAEGSLASAAGAASGAFGSIATALGLLFGVLTAIGSILAFFGDSSLKNKQKHAQEQKDKLDRLRDKINGQMSQALDIKQAPTAKFTPPSSITIEYNPIKDAEYHVILRGMKVQETNLIVIYDKVIPNASCHITDDIMYDVVELTVTVFGTITQKGHTFEGPKYCVNVADVDPTLHPPSKVTATYSQNDSQLIIYSTLVNYATFYCFELFGDGEQRKSISKKVSKPVSGAKNIVCNFAHSLIDMNVSEPFIVSCKAGSKVVKNFATSVPTFSNTLSLAPPVSNFVVQLPKIIIEEHQDIVYNWMYPTTVTKIKAIRRQITHENSGSVLIIHTDTSTHTDKLPLSDQFQIHDIILMLKEKHLVDPTKPLNLLCQVNCIGNSPEVIDSVFQCQRIISIQPPTNLTFHQILNTQSLGVYWDLLSNTDSCLVEILDDQGNEIVFSKTVENKCSILLDINTLNTKPNLLYSVINFSIPSHSEKLELYSLFPTVCKDKLTQLEAPEIKEVHFDFKAVAVVALFDHVKESTDYQILLLDSEGKILTFHTLHDQKEEHLEGQVSVHSLIATFKGGDIVKCACQTLGEDIIIDSKYSVFQKMLTVAQQPTTLQFIYDEKNNSIILKCKVEEGIENCEMGFIGSTHEILELVKVFDGNASIPFKTSVFFQYPPSTWKVTFQALGKNFVISSPILFLPNQLSVLPTPVITKSQYLASTDELDLAWNMVPNTNKFRIKITVLTGTTPINDATIVHEVKNDQNISFVLKLEPCFTNWIEILSKCDHITIQIISIGGDYYISSQPSFTEMQKLNKVENISITQPSMFLIVSWDKVAHASAYNVSFINNGHEILKKEILENFIKIPRLSFFCDNMKIQIIIYSIGIGYLPSNEVSIESVMKHNDIIKSKPIGTYGVQFQDELVSHEEHITGLKSVSVGFGKTDTSIDILYSIQADYMLFGGHIMKGDIHGFAEGNIANIPIGERGVVEVILESNDFYPCGITLIAESSNGSRTKYGPYGRNGKNQSIISGLVVGFYGSSGKYVYQLGCNFMPYERQEDLSKKTILIGGKEGKAFTDAHLPVIVAIKSMYIYYNADCIAGLQAKYYTGDGAEWNSPLHGLQGNVRKFIHFENDEDLTEVRIYSDGICVTGLLFITNLAKYGPFGQSTNQPQIIKSERINGFFGLIGDKNLVALGCLVSENMEDTSLYI